MKIALIGPTDITRISSFSEIPEKVYIQSARKLGALIAKYHHELIVVPDRGVAIEGLDSYIEHDGPKAIAISPQCGETEYQKATVKLNDHLTKCQEIVKDLSWCEQHSLICQMADLMVCCGISCGTISEIAWTKWMEKPLTYVCRDTITGIPPEILAEAHVKFIQSADNFEEILKQYNR
jgi:predicted Rossmann-fold nucleotide-binding protein